jgi:hypothetical protein
MPCFGKSPIGRYIRRRKLKIAFVFAQEKRQDRQAAQSWNFQIAVKDQSA